MKCPSCRQPVAEPVARCPHCGLTLHKLDLQFGVAPKHSGSLTDATHKLSAGDRRKLKTLLQLFHRKFPQSILSVLLTELKPGMVIGEYTFWLANRVRFGWVESKGEDNFDLLLVVDIAGGAAGMAAGYGLDRELAEGDLEAALEAGRNAFAEGDWATGIERCVNQLMERMREILRATES
ncbi:MAG TPA: TPM domain-containing protein [Chthoniobacterales bacterium]